MFEAFYGNAPVRTALERMIEGRRIAQTILLSGQEGIGKATLVRRFAAQLLGGAPQIEQDDLSREENRGLIAEREKWTSEKRAEDPLFFNTHPDFITVCPEGPLRQISIQQMRVLRERGQMLPMKGAWRIFLVDQIDRANPQAADSLLKTLEEPPSHLILFLTATNAYDLPATIRSRSIQFPMNLLPPSEMEQFAKSRQMPDAARRIALAAGSPGLAVTLDPATLEKRRALALGLLEAAGGATSFSGWVRLSEGFLASKSEKLDLYLHPLYTLLGDLISLSARGPGAPLRHSDLRPALERLSEKVSFEWLHEATRQLDEIAGLQRRNVQKGLSVDAYVTRLRHV